MNNLIKSKYDESEFQSLLNYGLKFEVDICNQINSIDGYKCKQIDYNCTQEFINNCQMDIFGLNKETKEYFRIDAKTQRTSFYCASRYSNGKLKPENCIAINVKALKAYQKSLIPSYLLIKTEADYLGKHGIYAIEVHSLTPDKVHFFQKHPKVAYDVINKYNFNLEDCIYVGESLKDLDKSKLDFILNHKPKVQEQSLF